MRSFALPALTTLLLTGCPVITRADLDGRVDQDGDGYISVKFEGDDCDDAKADIYPGAPDAPYDDVDADCSGGSDKDADSDGYDDLSHDGDDCDDADPAVNPGAAEVCDGLDNDCDGVIGDPADPSTDESDSDGDGYFVCAADCDDSEATINPGAAEICDPDSVDEDCDGSTDDGDPTATGQTDWYLDSDHDGYGTPDTVSSQCDEPAGFVDNADDCDDGDAAVSPETLWYADVDEDGWGDEFNTLASCLQPDGYLPDFGDCDDSDAEVSPDGADVPYDDVDSDCSGTSDDDADGDGHDALLRDGDDCDDTLSTVYPGAAEVCNGLDDDCDGVIGDVSDPSTDESDNDGDSFLVCENDCDDTNPVANPGATEICDPFNTDEDCDGSMDDGDGSATGQTSWYRDSDADGYGKPDTVSSQCDQPAGFVANALDCDDHDDAINPDTLWYADVDEDGWGDDTDSVAGCTQPTDYVADPGDCDDGDDAINPEALESCDGIDHDCDGLLGADDPNIDPAEAVWYRDRDSDGYGDGSASIVTCTSSGGYSHTAGDCDDFTSSNHPGAAEVCDTEDNDCDGEIDDADPDVTDMVTWYSDDDGDGYGDAAWTQVACFEPTYYVANDTDCDDTDGAVNPAAQEVCDTIDNDCDVEIDDADASVAPGVVTYTDSDGDGSGVTASATTVCVPPVSNVTVAGDCDDTRAAVSPSGTETCATTYDDDCDGSANDLDATSCTTRYFDGDGDTFGTRASECRCSVVGEYDALVSTDCDDASSTDHPGATETVGNQDDEDCDGGEICLLDNDDDGYLDTTGDTIVSVDADCTDAYEGTGTDLTTDCDDGDAGDHPGATEVVGNQDDEDCNGGEICYNDDDNDGYLDETGDTRVSADKDCVDAYEGTDTDPTTDCDDRDVGDHPGVTEIVGNQDDEDCDGGEICYDDDDDDGWLDTTGDIIASADTDCTDAYEGTSTDLTTDCDDGDAGDHPGATEIVGNGDDEDCNGAERCYDDDDDDGYLDAMGDTQVSADADCADANEGTNTDPTTDCDDTDADDHPGATETVGNGDDEDCDGAEICYDDADDDGYLDSSGATRGTADADCTDACEGSSTDPTTDCDDGEASVNPSGTEVCGNSLDDDCDGDMDTADWDCAEYTTLWGSEMIAIFAGSYSMGSGLGDPYSSYTDHTVTLTHDFWIGETEVTRSQWESWSGGAGWVYSMDRPCTGAAANCPANTVSWHDMAQYANALSMAEGLAPCYLTDGTDLAVAYRTDPYSCPGYRLPTEAEWEYAARAGEDTTYSGSNTSADVAWTYANAYALGTSSHEVAMLAPNAWGLYDMTGNLWEWTDDWYSSIYDGYGTGSAVTDPPGPTSGSTRVLRGGGWDSGVDSDIDYAAVSFRIAVGSPAVAYQYIGFRLARSSP